jgi:transcription elongation factor GreA
MAEKTKLTKAGYKKLEEELRYLIDVARDEVKRELAEARAQGDLSENADYDAARGKQAEVEARIKEIEATLNNAEILEENSKSNKVGLGSTVTVKFIEKNEEKTYMIVGSIESNPFEGKISSSCALGEAILGKLVGDIIEVKAIKPYKVQIISIGAKK